MITQHGILRRSNEMSNAACLAMGGNGDKYGILVRVYFYRQNSNGCTINIPSSCREFLLLIGSKSPRSELRIIK